MTVTTSWQGRVLVASLRGEIDMQNQHSVAASLADLAAADATGLVLNFAEVVYIASVGIGMLINLVKSGRDRGLSVRLAAARPAVKMILEMVRVESIIPMDPTVEDAVQRVTPAAV